jgi:uncharacterized protein
MPQLRRNSSQRLDPREPLVFSTRALRRGAGAEHTETRTVPAPAELRVGLVGVPEGAELELNVRLEAVTEGVLVTATAQAPLAGECARCLEPVAQQVEVGFQELFGYAPSAGGDAADGYSLDGDLLDIEPALRDALVLALPLAPLCRDDCPGLCVDCGAQLATAGPEHSHGPAIDPRWAGLQELPQFEEPQFEAPQFDGSQFDGSQFEAPRFEAPQYKTETGRPDPSGPDLN